MNKKIIDDLLQYGERVTLECKKAETALPKSVWETYSAFANTFGGVIFLGEPITWMTFFGSTIIIIGIWQVTRDAS